MITEQDLNAAIAECQGKRNPDSSTCIKLAAFYTIRRELFGETDKSISPQYSYAPAPEDIITISTGSEFAKAIDGKDQADVWPVLDELMETIKALHPRLYNAVLDRLNR